MGRYKALFVALLHFIMFFGFLPQMLQIIENPGITAVSLYDGFLYPFFQADGLAVSMGILISGLGGLIALYTYHYMNAIKYQNIFYSIFLIYTLMMLAFVFSNNMLFSIIVLEAASILYFFLMVINQSKAQSLKSLMRFLIVNGLIALFLFSGIIWIGENAGSYVHSVWCSLRDELTNENIYIPALLLIIIGSMLKSIQIPFKYWKPGDQHAIFPVSAYGHSVTVGISGIFLLARLNPVLGSTTYWMYILSTAGIFFMLTGAYLALRKTNIHSILSYTTINAMGILLLLIGINTPLSLKAALLFFFVHAFYKSTLYLVGGLIRKKTNIEDFRTPAGLIKSFPVTFIVTLLAALSMAGIPPMLGFLSKELIYEAKIYLPGISSGILLLGVIANIMMVAVAFMLVYKIFIGNLHLSKRKKHTVSFLSVIPMLIVLLNLIFGLFPGLLGKTLVENSLQSVYSNSANVHLIMFEGFNDIFWLSSFTTIAGLLLTWILINYQHKNSIPFAPSA
ncbi:MAG: hypothetical protein K9I29_01155 [Bacteroidales bacterium]|nr:hypothetical protein [Bacteroidales bacterium]MCF8326876.1 hypothetical protein [Bacteroidales bacterium]